MAWFLAPVIGSAIGGLAAKSAVGASIGGILGSTISQRVAAGKQADAAREEARLSNEATDRAFAYDLDLWEAEKEKILSDREHAVRVVELNASNERKIADYQDALNLERYNQDVMIRDREQESLNKQFDRSETVYTNQLSLNILSERNAREAERRSLDEIGDESRYEKAQQKMDFLVNEGKVRAAAGGDSRTARKLAQVEAFTWGEAVKAFNDSIATAGKASEAALKEIALDKYAADLSAFAARMLDPGVLPEVIMPQPIPVADFLYPRAITDYDFGPVPVHGVRKSANAAANKVWGAAMPGIASTTAELSTKIVDSIDWD